MKTIFKYLYLSCIFLVVGCDEFLDEAPETFVTPQNFYLNEQQFDEAVAAIYNTNRALLNDEHWRFGENRADNSSFQFNPADRGGLPNEEVDLFLMLSANPNLAGYWNTSYSGISRANFALENLESIEFDDPSLANTRRGEILFMRSWFYFNLVQLYGDVPLVVTASTNPDELLSEQYVDRTAVAEVYDRILADAQEAIDLLPVPANTETGRASQGAALMLKAKMHMVLQEFGEAQTLLERILNLGYILQPEYASIFNPANKNSGESIIEVQYSFPLGQGSDFVTRFVPFNSGTDVLGANGPAGSRAGQNQPTQSLIDLYEEGDARLAHNVSFYESGGNSIPWMSKFNYGFVTVGNNTQDVNYPMFRYADALLMLAECYIETGRGDAAALVLQVRQRSLPGAVLSPEETADIEQTIADERRRELAFENHRYFDLVRTGKLVEVMTAHGMELKAQNETIPPDAYTNIRTILGLPLGQIEEFGFEQNPNW